jgi:glycine dehydrogenase subunit 2
MEERRLIFEKGVQGRKTGYFPAKGLDSAEKFLNKDFLRQELPFPSLGELDVVRHYTGLSRLNFSVDNNFYPLGSCTMKYNPKINEALSALPGFCDIHPYQKEDTLQGAMELIYNLDIALQAITGMKRFSFQASSGAQGEFTGMMMIRRYHDSRKSKKNKVIVPDSAHGTNPATASMCGYQTVVVGSDKDGLIDMEKLSQLVDDDTAAIMLTNPNTLGLFEENILEISRMIHDKGGLLYYDGANFNALLGATQPALMGFDVIHLNLHKTFATPHGCGGPGAGAVGVNEKLLDFLPGPLVGKKDDKFFWDYNIKNSIGRVRSFYGNFLVLVRAYAYILSLGKDGVERVSENAVLSANYIKERLSKYYQTASDKRCMHEVVFSCVKQKEKGVSAMDIAKRLIDYGIHPPTMYFPLIVKEALMVEPTETESKQTLDEFIDVMIKIDQEIASDPDKLHSAPYNSPICRADDVRAARQPDLRYRDVC